MGIYDPIRVAMKGISYYVTNAAWLRHEDISAVKYAVYCYSNC